MGDVWLGWLADELRAAGLTVIEYDGWQTRARSSGGYEPGRPWLVMWHHTASSASAGDDADYEAVGADAAPICNVNIDRDGAVWVLAAGATNTNGKGDPVTVSKGTVPADQMNTHAFGMEISNTGVGEPYPQAQIDAAFTVSNVVNRRCGNLPTDVGTHADYSPGRKIDPATAAAVQGPWRPAGYSSADTWVRADVAAECARRASTAPTPDPDPTPGDTDMASTQLLLHDVRNDGWYKVGPTSMTWVQDGNALAQMLARVGECADGKVSPVDGYVWRRLDHGGDDVIASYGPIDGDLPPGRDRYGRAT